MYSFNQASHLHSSSASEASPRPAFPLMANGTDFHPRDPHRNKGSYSTLSPLGFTSQYTVHSQALYRPLSYHFKVLGPVFPPYCLCLPKFHLCSFSTSQLNYT